MTLDSISIPLAAAAGAASFLSPCVLPLVPAYLGFLGGSAVGGVPTGGIGGAEERGTAARPTAAGAVPRPRPPRLMVLGSAAAFVLGLSLLFILAFYALQTVLDPWRGVLLPALGAVVVVLGLQYMGVVRIP